jgi:hypothetical protein
VTGVEVRRAAEILGVLKILIKEDVDQVRSLEDLLTFT